MRCMRDQIHDLFKKNGTKTHHLGTFFKIIAYITLEFTVSTNTINSSLGLLVYKTPEEN
jgi:hypothetical protein